MTKTIRVSERTYERIRARQRDGETTAEALDRLVQGRPLTDFVGGLVDEEATHARETVATAEEATRQESEATVERVFAGDEPEEHEDDPP